MFDSLIALVEYASELRGRLLTVCVVCARCVCQLSGSLCSRTVSSGSGSGRALREIAGRRRHTAAHRAPSVPAVCLSVGRASYSVRILVSRLKTTSTLADDAHLLYESLMSLRRFVAAFTMSSLVQYLYSRSAAATVALSVSVEDN